MLALSTAISTLFHCCADILPEPRVPEEEWTCHDCSESTPHQDNGDDCGVFTLLAISLLAQGIDVTQSLYSQRMIYRQKCRLRIAYLLWKDGGI